MPLGSFSFGMDVPIKASNIIRDVYPIGGNIFDASLLGGVSSVSWGVFISILGSFSWKDEAAKVEEGWITMKGYKYETSTPSFNMTLRSHKGSTRGKL